MLVQPINSLKITRLERPLRKQLLTNLFDIYETTTTQCGLFTLVDQMLEQNAKKQAANIKSIKPLSVAEKLLSASDRLTIGVRSPATIPPEAYAENMLHIADTIAKDTSGQPPLLSHPATTLVAAFEEMETHLTQEGAIQDPIHAKSVAHDPRVCELYKKFDGCWYNFTLLYLHERLYQLKNLSPSHIVEKLREIQQKLYLSPQR